MKPDDQTKTRRRRIAADVADRARMKRHMQVGELAEMTGRHRSVVSEALNGKLVSEETTIAIEIALTPPMVDGLMKAIMEGDISRIRRMDLEPGFAAYIIEELSEDDGPTTPEFKRATGS